MNNKNLLNHNNWLKNKGNVALSILDEYGISIYLGKKGDINIKLSNDKNYESTKDFKSLENIFKNITGEDIDLSAFYKKEKVLTIENGLEEKLKISPEDLKLVTEEIFDPFSKEEFILQDNYTYKLNNFKPSVYMLLDYELKKELKFHLENSAIGKLILHLVNYNRKRLYWVINWLAYFFQGLKKSQVALVLLGEQGAGKGILFNEVIKPLFGEAFVKTINDKSLNTNYKGSLVENTLFSNLDEISAKNSSSSVKNFLKALVTNASITAEKKFKNLEKETPIYGQILITSNELYALEIEPSDRRFTVFSTSGNLSYYNFLGYGNYEVLSNSIQNELELFAIYLKNYSVDEKIANTALTTPEKYNLIQQYQMTNYKPIKLTKLQKNVLEFSEAIRCRNLNLFNTIVDENKFQLKNEILLDFQYGIFRVENLLPAFKTLYGSRSFGTNSELLRELQKFNFNLFSTQNIQLCQIKDEQKDCFILPRFFLNGLYNV
ncbi:primase-helicase family protein [Aliarcobacter cryaerophilus]|uniref:primase-helicase family protein n=1 Tax=Aliarcobacter cryaerophilus TaxID=28198 RepID=UPI003DA41DD9